MPESLNQRVANATRWSAMTEAVAKMVVPVTGMVLAHLLTPEAFGIVATLTMIITFAELFTDAGFQKYLIQHDFENTLKKEKSTNVAFWSNLALSLTIWIIIILFADPLAAMVGNPGLGNVLIIACASIPINAFSSIQIALFRRDLNFKALFKVRFVGVIVPLVVTIPLAYFTRSFWALIFGTLSQNVVNACLLNYHSSWRPKWFYSFSLLREMFGFTMWSMLEQLAIWLTTYIDVFIVGTMLSQYYLGLYKTSSTLVAQVMGLITATITPVLFSSLSKLQKKPDDFTNMFFRFQKIVSILVLPLGTFIFLFSDLITKYLLGEKWVDASGFIGLWGLTSGLAIVYSQYCSEVFRAIGKPKLSLLSQICYMFMLFPTVLCSVKYGFEVLYISRSLIRVPAIIIDMLFMMFFIRISFFSQVINAMPALVASCAMILVCFLLKPVDISLIEGAFYAFLSLAIYFIIICLFRKDRIILCSLVQTALAQVKNVRLSC